MTHPGSRPYVWMLCGSLSFTVMAELASGVTKVCDWTTVAVARAFLVFVFATIIAVACGVKLVWLRPARLWVRSIAGSFSMVCTFYAFHELPRSSDVLTLANTFPIWVAILSWPLYGHMPGRNVWVAVVAGVVGVALIEQPHLDGGRLGVLSALAAAGFTAVAMLGLHALHDIDPRAVVVHFSGVATVVCLGAYLVLPRPEGSAGVLEPHVYWPLLGMGVAATFGQIFLTLAFASGAPAKVSVVGLTQIVFSLLFEVVFLGHGLNALTLLGTALVVTPTAWLLTRPTGAASQDAHEPTSEPIPTATAAELRDAITPSLRP